MSYQQRYRDSPTPPPTHSAQSSYEERSSLSMAGHHTPSEMGEHPYPQQYQQYQQHQQRQQLPPRSPLMTEPHQPLLSRTSPTPQGQTQGQFVSSPLKPNSSGNSSSSTSIASSSPFGSRSRTPSMHHLSRLPSEETQILMSNPRSPSSNNNNNRGSMILWRLASEEESVPFPGNNNNHLSPPNEKRYSIGSHKSSSQMSYTEDSKYPSTRPLSGFVAYAYDPLEDPDGDFDDYLDDEDVSNASKLRKRGEKSIPRQGGAGGSRPPPKKYVSRKRGCNWRGVMNVLILTVLILGTVSLFTVFPIVRTLANQPIIQKITGNVQVNLTGQVPDLPNLPQLVDRATPDSAKTRTGWDGKPYTLVFSDEFETPNRTFLPGDDPFWEAVDLWYWPTSDMEWYDPRQITTRDGKLVITMDNVENHNLSFRSGMLQSWNKFCFTNGYIEVSLQLPGANSDVMGYWPGAWIMGNLGRPGYGASTDGTWPYSYDTCDLGTYPNQTFPDKSGPPAALLTNEGRPKYNNELSWLPGQRLSSCTCPGQDHPGPTRGNGFIGRGAPEIDILEAEKNKHGPGGQVSQSAQFAPFNADYQANYSGMTIYDTTITQRNSYNGSGVQQAITCLTQLPETVFAGSGGVFTTFGFEYFADPNDRENAYVTWLSDGKWSYNMMASTVGPDPISQISARLVAEEPMSIILNLGMSTGFQTVDLSTLTFPAEFLVDYVRVYQRDGAQNIGCDPPDRPTAQYINDHIKAYTDANLTTWSATEYALPRNQGFYGSC